MSVEMTESFFCHWCRLHKHMKIKSESTIVIINGKSQKRYKCKSCKLKIEQRVKANAKKDA